MNRATLGWLAAGIAAGIALGLPGVVGVLSLALPLSVLWVVIIEGPDRPPGVDHRGNWRKWQEEAEIARASNVVRPFQRSRRR
jgi:hypothetical protein